MTNHRVQIFGRMPTGGTAYRPLESIHADRSPAGLARSAPCGLDDCPLDAVFDTGRCLPHQEPVRRAGDATEARAPGWWRTTLAEHVQITQADLELQPAAAADEPSPGRFQRVADRLRALAEERSR